MWPSPCSGCAILLLVAGAGLGIGAASAMGDAGFFWEVLGATLAYTPALWLTAALAITMFGIIPRAVGLAWALLAYAVFVVYLGGLLQLPG
jgi:ABC-2 type transport system permease protein